MNLCNLSIHEAQALLQKGEISSRQLTLAALERIHALNDSLHAFLYIAAEAALTQADEADRKRRSTEPAQNPLRPDQVRPGLTQAALLNGAAEKEGAQFKIPPVFE